METNSRLDQHLIKRAAGIIAVADAHVQKALKRQGKRDRISRDLLELGLGLIEDAQHLLVLVSTPVQVQEEPVLRIRERRQPQQHHRVRKVG